MWQFKIVLDLTPPGDTAELRKIINGSYYELCGRDDIFDPWMSAILETGELTFTVALDTTSRDETIKVGTSAVRSALHGQGAGTPLWEESVEAWIENSEQASKPILVDA